MESAPARAMPHAVSEVDMSPPRRPGFAPGVAVFGRRARRRPAAIGGALLLAVGAAIPDRALSYDAWGWLLWGQELLDGRRFTTNGYPTWKPLAGLISLGIAPLDGGAPFAWLVIARGGALAALWLAYRLGSRLAGPVAGGLAVGAVLVMPQWLFQAGVGGSEPLVTALLLGALLRHSDADHLGGFLLVLLAA